MQQTPEQDSQFAAEHSADVSREELAEVYAAALNGACQSSGVSFTEVTDEFGSFVTEALDANKTFEQLLASAMVPTREKQRILTSLLADATPLFRNFLMTAARRGRLDLLREMYVQCRKIDDANRGRVPVTVTTASPLDQETFGAIAEKLRAILGGEPVIHAVIDPEVIGGIIVRIGDKIFDASIATQLENVRQQIVDRSAHEIQSRRNSFSNPEGN
ncbi:MAG: ATP synthase F1 subunit delta [Thermoguttaceae bacterium]|nr:ATP synthase F1 subunit delta [Thermoguttaceae bacterium]MBQ2682998.1 ATP synthase F1 subunit delta [Thermoguttaceae bacterium]MBQ6619919.1 ATP synthase F1 subunit delta [Thermoguttaceae bacterium]MBR3219130.1 ATP synthase F1 subunit delta [Thermoguttaceae bacterium]